MSVPTSLPWFLGIASVLAALEVRRRGAVREWKLLAFVAFFAMPVVFAWHAIGVDLHNMKTVAFCGSCHVMEEHSASLTVRDDEPLSSVHYRNNYVKQETACYECHATYAMFGGVRTKVYGLRHVWANFTADVAPADIKMYRPYNNHNCLRCHETSERFRKQKKHRANERFIEDSRSNAVSCLKSGCHDLAHRIASREEADDDEW